MAADSGTGAGAAGGTTTAAGAAGAAASAPGTAPAAGTAWPPVVVTWIADVLVYVVVLNLVQEYAPQVVTETFTLSLLTAVLLKAVLEVVLLVKRPLKARLKAATTLPGRLAAFAVLWAVLVASKFVVLEAVRLAFSDRVQLGGFFAVTGLVLGLLLARLAVRRALDAVATG